MKIIEKSMKINENHWKIKENQPKNKKIIEISTPLGVLTSRFGLHPGAA